MPDSSRTPQGDGWSGQALSATKEWLEKLFETRTLKLLILTALAFLIAIVVPSRLDDDLVWGGHPASSFLSTSFSVIGAVLMLATIVSGLMELGRGRSRPAAETPAESGAPEADVLGGAVVLGINVGRARITYGALRIDPHDRGGASPLGNVRTTEMVGTKVKYIEGSAYRSHIYTLIVDAIAELIDALDPERCQVDGIAITTPSWIDIRTKLLESPIGPFPVNERLAEELAVRLWKTYPDHVRRAFHNLDEQPHAAEHILARVFLDTDARSVARFDLHEQLKNGNAIRNYACILALEGVGAGLVLNGEVYYGSHGSEGEIGHTTVHLGPEYAWPASPMSATTSAHCDCELPGFHWETLSSTRGLLLIAATISRTRFDALRSVHQGEFTSRDFIDAACYSLDGQGSRPHPGTVRILDGDAHGYRGYFGDVLREYARIFTIGVANIANVLDLECIVIGGSLIVQLDRLPLRNEIRAWWDQYVLRGHSVRQSYKPLSQLWQGAALLFWDPSYYRQIAK